MMLDASSQSPRPRRASAPSEPVSKKTKPSPQKTGGIEKMGPTLEQCLVLPVGIDPPLLEGALASSRTRSKSEYCGAAEARKAVAVDDDDRAIISSFNYASVGSREEAKEVNKSRSRARPDRVIFGILFGNRASRGKKCCTVCTMMFLVVLQTIMYHHIASCANGPTAVGGVPPPLLTLGYPDTYDILHRKNKNKKFSVQST